MVIEELFYSSVDKHAKWHELGKPMVPSGVQLTDAIQNRFKQENVRTKVVRNTLWKQYREGHSIQLRYAEKDGKLVRRKQQEIDDCRAHRTP